MSNTIRGTFSAILGTVSTTAKAVEQVAMTIDAGARAAHIVAETQTDRASNYQEITRIELSGIRAERLKELEKKYGKLQPFQPAKEAE